MDVVLLLLVFGSSFGSDDFRFLVSWFLFQYDGFLDDSCLLNCLDFFLDRLNDKFVLLKQFGCLFPLD